MREVDAPRRAACAGIAPGRGRMAPAVLLGALLALLLALPAPASALSRRGFEAERLVHAGGRRRADGADGRRGRRGERRRLHPRQRQQPRGALRLARDVPEGLGPGRGDGRQGTPELRERERMQTGARRPRQGRAAARGEHRRGQLDRPVPRRRLRGGGDALRRGSRRPRAGIRIHRDRQVHLRRPAARAHDQGRRRRTRSTGRARVGRTAACG